MRASHGSSLLDSWCDVALCLVLAHTPISMMLVVYRRSCSFMRIASSSRERWRIQITGRHVSVRFHDELAELCMPVASPRSQPQSLFEQVLLVSVSRSHTRLCILPLDPSSVNAPVQV